MTKRVLLTGASGFVGSHVLESLLAETPHDVVVICSFTCNGTMDRLTDVVERVRDRHVTLIRHDLTAPLTSRRELARLGEIDWILDVASRSSVDESLREPVCFIQDNVAVTLNTLEIARNRTPNRYVHLSTDEVYGAHSPLTDTDHRPSSPYSASKAAQESICHAYARSYGIPLTIVNPSNMFGERQSTLAFVPRIVKAVLSGATLPLHVDRDGHYGRRRYTYAGDVANWIVTTLVETDDQRNLPPRMPLPGLHELDNRALAHLVATTLNHDLRYEDQPAESVRPGYDSGYELPLPVDGWLDVEDHRTPNDRDALLADRIERTVTWFAEHPEWLE